MSIKVEILIACDNCGATKDIEKDQGLCNRCRGPKKEDSDMAKKKTVHQYNVNGQPVTSKEKLTKGDLKTVAALLAPIAAIAPSKKGQKFDGDFSKLPSSRTLLALVIKSIESGETLRLPTDKDEALAMLGYERSTAPKSKVAA